MDSPLSQTETINNSFEPTHKILDVLLTVHLSIILVIKQIGAQNLVL